MRNDHHTTLVLLNSLCKSTETISVQVICRLVKNKNMGLIPHSSSNHNLHLLSTRKGRHAVVASKLRLKTNIAQLLLNIGGGQCADIQTSSLGIACINSLAVLVPSSHLEDFVVQVTLITTLVFHLILILLVFVLAPGTSQFTDNLIGLALHTTLVRPVHLKLLLLKLLLLLSQNHTNLDQRLLVLTIGIPPANVLIGGLVQVCLNVVEGMLGNIGNTGIGVLPDLSSLRHNFTCQNLDHGTLSCSILTHTSNS
mmetsp:Transcript_17836/g.26011  ORF Transcript_17836/g.26011 Transcript_17836/m.26011 type:complete len:254 (-) Transcript_17836:2173-2934(-)